jgi:hypothetical protein
MRLQTRWQETSAGSLSIAEPGDVSEGPNKKQITIMFEIIGGTS